MSEDSDYPVPDFGLEKSDAKFDYLYQEKVSFVASQIKFDQPFALG